MTTKASPPSTTTNSTSNVKIKKEVPSDEIKDFAATAMNELLGWYGYDGVDRLDLSTKTSRLMQHVSNEIDSIQQHHNNNRSQRGGGGGGDSTTSEQDTRSRSSREDSKSPNSSKLMAIDKQEPTCGWCRRLVPENSPDFLTTPDGPRYCSESCFGQSRRASFKKAKTCDWCKHVRHAVSYVDFQDGASQLQFCSDKCLNQYKMQIFCKETQAHLDMNPHLKETGLEATSSLAGLITPDLWLKNCRSRSASPASTVSVSPTPPPTLPPSSSRNTPQPQLHKPMISVAPVAKLMSQKSPGIMNNRQSPKHSSRRKRVAARNGPPPPLPPNNGTIQNNNYLANSLNNNGGSASTSSKSRAPPTPSPKPPPFAAHDLRTATSPLSSPLDGSQQHAAPRLPSSQHHLHQHHSSAIPPSFFAQNYQQNFASRPPFLPTSHPRFLGLPPPHLIPPDIANFAQSFLGATPPITVMVPYPVVIPLPIPIPIPLPLIDFLKAAQSSQETSNPRTTETTNEDETTAAAAEEPLDCTKTKPEPERNSAASPAPISEPIESKVPKLKITRLHAKRSLITTTTTKESECSRPLRKRKRLIDCDYQKESPPPRKEDADVEERN